MSLRQDGSNNQIEIDWSHPQPRPGLVGVLDRLCGPGTTALELWLTFGFGLFAGIFVPSYAILNRYEWTLLQLIVATWVAFDLAGGVVANATSAAKRWWHRQEQGWKQQFLFVAVHIYPFIVAWLFRSSDWVYAGVIYGYLLIAALIILNSALYLQRPIALVLFCGGILINIYGFTSTPGLEWFVPFLFLKLLVSHLLKEAPYQPEEKIGIANSDH